MITDTAVTIAKTSVNLKTMNLFCKHPYYHKIHSCPEIVPVCFFFLLSLFTTPEAKQQPEIQRYYSYYVALFINS